MIVFHLAAVPIPAGRRAILTARKELLSYLPRTLYAYGGDHFALRDLRIDGCPKLGDHPRLLGAFSDTYGPMHEAIGTDWIRAGGDFEIEVENLSREPRGFFAAWGCNLHTGTMGEAIDRYEDFLRTGRILKAPGESPHAPELPEGRRQLPDPDGPRAARVHRALRKGGGR